jgi:hypothetical protein
MEIHEKDFLIAEYNKSWDMVLAIDLRRGIFSRYYNILFLSVLAVSINIAINYTHWDLKITLGLSLLFIFTILAGKATKGILESEREANVRYRKKINLIREVVLNTSKNELIQEYLTHTELGIKLLSQESEQPKGVGRTLVDIYHLILVQQVVMALGVIIVWTLLYLN